MADSPISGLPETTIVGDDDLILLEQNATAKKVSGRNWKQYFNANVVTASATTVEPTLNPTATYNQYTNNLSLTLPSADYIDTVTKTGQSHLTDEYTITSKLGHTGKFYVTNGAGAVDTVNGQPVDEYGNVQLYGTNITMSSTDDDTIQSRIAQAESDISDLDTAVDTKAAQTDLDTANGRITGLESDVSDITVKIGYVSLTTTWQTFTTGVYRQGVTIYTAASGGTAVTVTSKTKVDVQPDSTALLKMVSDGTSAIYISNDSGTLRAYAISEATTSPLTLQVTYYEMA